MTCPDWTRLSAHRADPRRAEPAGWELALAHLDGCGECRRIALAADPTLAFRRLAVVDVAPAGDSGDVEAMREAVAAMRRASRLLPPSPGRRRPRSPAVDRAVAAARDLFGRGWTRAAAAVVLAAGLLALAPSHPPPAPLGAAMERVVAAAGGPVVAGPVPRVGAGLAAPARASWAVDSASAAPIFEGLDRPQDARVYQLDGDGLVVVMIIDETLDV
jgi:hypothetical protein